MSRSSLINFSRFYVLSGAVCSVVSCVIGVFGSDVRVIVWMYFFVVVGVDVVIVFGEVFSKFL